MITEARKAGARVTRVERDRDEARERIAELEGILDTMPNPNPWQHAQMAPPQRLCGCGEWSADGPYPWTCVHCGSTHYSSGMVIEATAEAGADFVLDDTGSVAPLTPDERLKRIWARWDSVLEELAK